ncbi:hypothetical protein G6O67_008049 [Ophiocordyceps sinensis]|uniref:Uncharacterized protein n=2 Tax=Ophiocordyceps sinensis TaxID=72228 RepID=A0A8H4LSS0_9HYPO|nr:hypothetical protein G6O67_008049 [Ophiocordyceps sinensis]
MEHVSDDRRRSSSRHPGPRDTRRQADDIVNPDSRTSSLKGEEGAPSAASAGGALKPRRTLSSTTLHCRRLLCCTPGTGGGRPREFVRNISRSKSCLSVAPDSEARHGPRVSATNAKGSISSGASKASISSVSTEAESVKSIPSSQAVRLMEGLLNTPSSDQAQSHQALSGAGKPTPASGGEPKPSAVGAETLYILSSSHRDTACYMYRTETGDSQDLYAFDHVPVRAIHGCGGQPAYLMAMSDKDPTVDSLRYKCTFPAPGVEASLARASSTAKMPPDGRSEAGGCGFGGKAEPAGHVSGCMPQFIQQDMVQAVIDKVRNQLPSRTRRLDSLANDDASNDILYLVSDKDIVDSVSLAFAELVQADDATPSKRISARGGRALPSLPSLPKPNCQCNMITPGLAAAADPAITISVPKASFSNTGGADGGGRAGIKCPDVSTKAASTKAAVVSRRRATEIVWMENEADDGQYATKRASGTDPGLVCKDHSCPLRKPSLVKGPKRDGSLSKATTSASSSLADREANMRSFPELQPRQRTNEWPPAEMDQLSKACPPNFYRMGVDAHGGAGASDSWPDGLAQEPVVNALHCDDSLFGGNPFHGDGGGLSTERQSTRRPSSMTADKRLGTCIGSASHRRRSTQAVDTSSWQGESTNSDSNKCLLLSLLDWLRWNGQNIFHRHDDCPAPPTTPASPARGIRETGAKGGGRQCATCSEDTRPHVCEDDLDSTSGGGVSSTG